MKKFIARLFHISTTYPRRTLSYLRPLNAEVTDKAAVTATNRAQLTAKRFWKTVGIEDKLDCLIVTLDKRPLRTPEGSILAIPRSKRLLASLVAHEWDNQETLIKPFALPMTSLAARAIDSFKNDSSRAETRGSLIKYLDTDTLCFFSDKPPNPFATDQPPTLLELQQKHWVPLLEWAQNEFNVEIKRFDSIISSTQPKGTKKVFRELLDSLDPWQLVAVERAVYASKSFIIAIALLKGRVSAEEAAQAAQVEVTSQMENWGEVEDSHDVEFQDIRRQLSSAACVLINC